MSVTIQDLRSDPSGFYLQNIYQVLSNPNGSPPHLSLSSSILSTNVCRMGECPLFVKRHFQSCRCFGCDFTTGVGTSIHRCHTTAMAYSRPTGADPCNLCPQYSWSRHPSGEQWCIILLSTDFHLMLRHRWPHMSSISLVLASFCWFF